MDVEIRKTAIKNLTRDELEIYALSLLVVIDEIEKIIFPDSLHTLLPHPPDYLTTNELHEMHIVTQKVALQVRQLSNERN